MERVRPDLRQEEAVGPLRMYAGRTSCPNPRAELLSAAVRGAYQSRSTKIRQRRPRITANTRCRSRRPRSCSWILLRSRSMIQTIPKTKTASSRSAIPQGIACCSLPTPTARIEFASSAPGGRRERKHMTTKKARSRRPDELRREYKLSDLANPARGKYRERARAGSNLVLLDADVARAFPTAEAVNEALRLLVAVARTRVRDRRKTRRPA